MNGMALACIAGPATFISLEPTGIAASSVTGQLLNLFGHAFCAFRAYCLLLEHYHMLFLFCLLMQHYPFIKHSCDI
jgi:hypothetical protein